MTSTPIEVVATGPRGPGLSEADQDYFDAQVAAAEASADTASAGATAAAAASFAAVPRLTCEGHSIPAAAHKQTTGHTFGITWGNGELTHAHALFPYFQFDQWQDNTDVLYDSSGCNCAIGSTNTTDLLARLDIVLNVCGDYVLIDTGFRDINEGGTAAGVMALVEQVCEQFITRGKVVLLCSQRPVNATFTGIVGDWSDSGDRIPVLLAFNALMETYATTTPNVVFVDTFTAYSDGASPPRPKAGYTTDGVHPSRNGAAMGGLTIANELRKLIKPLAMARPSGTSIVAGSDFAGTGGTASTGVTGTVASTWIATRTSNDGVLGGACVASKGAGGEQIFTFTPGGDTWERLRLTKTSGGAVMDADKSYKGWYHVVLSNSAFWRGVSFQFSTQSIGMGLVNPDIIGAHIPIELFDFRDDGLLELFVQSPVNISAGESGVVSADIIIDGASTDPSMVATIYEYGVYEVADPRPLHGFPV